MPLFLNFDRELDDVEPFSGGNAMSKAIRRLDDIAEEIGVTKLSTYMGGEDEDLMEIAEQHGWDDGGFGKSGGNDGWFDAHDGLDTTRALLGYIESDPECLKRPKATSADLRELEAILEKAAAEGLRFRFEADE